MAFTPAESIIGFLKRQLGLTEEGYAVLEIWKNEMRPRFPYAELVGIKKGQIIIEASSSAGVQELTMRRREIMNTINQYFAGRRVIRDIKIQLKM